MKLVRYTANVVATVVLGFLISRWIATLPYEFPALPASIRSMLNAFGVDTVANADDIETIGLLVIIIVSMVGAGALVWLLNRILCSRRSAASSPR